ncbi:hypothetical protein ACFO6Q_11590 [Dokdonella ginsengisoli]|uniref:Uncharacterized protein n=1 Tax=Dokdonella ginsengisoli TaxID=363846 RepID=A0ABV9QVZ0_9GAMM
MAAIAGTAVAAATISTAAPAQRQRRLRIVLSTIAPVTIALVTIAPVTIALIDIALIDAPLPPALGGALRTAISPIARPAARPIGQPSPASRSHRAAHVRPAARGRACVRVPASPERRAGIDRKK